MRFELAEMSPSIRTLTYALLALMAGVGIAALLGIAALAIPALAMLAISAWVWLRFRPKAFRRCSSRPFTDGSRRRASLDKFRSRQETP